MKEKFQIKMARFRRNCRELWSELGEIAKTQGSDVGVILDNNSQIWKEGNNIKNTL